MPPAPRGSATLPARQLAELKKIAESTGKLVYWFPKGQPNPTLSSASSSHVETGSEARSTRSRA